MKTFEVQAKAQPLVKWVGGKRQLQEQIFSKMPLNFNTYFEPFLGGGAMFFRLAPTTSVLSDLNAGLINLYECVKSEPESIEKIAAEISSNFNALSIEEQERYFLSLRAEYNTNYREGARQAAVFLFLNKAGFNGMYRENQTGDFNIPFGGRNKIKKINLFETGNLKAVSLLLQRATLKHASFEEILHKEFVQPAKKGDLVYLDPPYIPLSKTSSFTSYTKENFSSSEQIQLQERLVSVIDDLSNREVAVVLSNSSAGLSSELFELKLGMQKQELPVTRLISGLSKGRTKVTELVLWNDIAQKALEKSR
jgi:DNA adenine methylase